MNRQPTSTGQDSGSLQLTASLVRRRAQRLYASPYATRSAKRDAAHVLGLPVPDGRPVSLSAALALLARELGAEVVE